MPGPVVHLIGAARPNFMKVAPLYHALAGEDWCSVEIVHTGQHYDANMSEAFFRDLGLPEPDHHLGVGSGSHGVQTAGVIVAYEQLCERRRPDWTVVVGDVNSTVACALVCTKLWIPVAHLEAGLRSGDRRMPEEINRVLTDAIADLLWTPSADADQNLQREGIPESKIERIGNIMIDSYEMLRDKISAQRMREQLGLIKDGYGVVTLHRPSNVDVRDTLAALVDALVRAAQHVPLVFPIHPRTRARLREFGLEQALVDKALTLIEPLGYLQFMNLVTGAKLVVTDSGGIQEETTYLNIPCLTLRDTTERPITLTQGTNRLVKVDTLVDNVVAASTGGWPQGRCPALWDGHTAARAAESLRRRLSR